MILLQPQEGPVQEYNPHHDKHGRFASDGSYSGAGGEYSVETHPHISNVVKHTNYTVHYAPSITGADHRARAHASAAALATGVKSPAVHGDHSIALPTRADRKRLAKRPNTLPIPRSSVRAHAQWKLSPGDLVKNYHTMHGTAKTAKRLWPWLNASASKTLNHVKM